MDGQRLKVAGAARAARNGSKWSVDSMSSAHGEGDEAARRIIGRDTLDHAVVRCDFNLEAAHLAAELGGHVISGVTLHPVRSAPADCDNCALHVVRCD